MEILYRISESFNQMLAVEKKPGEHQSHSSSPSEKIAELNFFIKIDPIVDGIF